MAEIFLWFAKSKEGAYELERTLFLGHPDGKEIMAIRGKTAGAYKDVGAFQWTPGVKGIAVVFLTALVKHLRYTKTNLPLIEGGRGSLASSLDYALYKQPEWLFDMFGSDEKADAYLRQLILRTNAGIRRAGNVGISLNQKVISPGSIHVYIGESQVTNVEELEQIIQKIIYADQIDSHLGFLATQTKSKTASPENVLSVLGKATNLKTYESVDDSNQLAQLVLATSVEILEPAQTSAKLASQELQTQFRNWNFQLGSSTKVLDNISIGQNANALVIEVQPDNWLVNVLKGNLFVEKENWQYHRDQQWGKFVFPDAEPSPTGFEPSVFAVLPNSSDPPIIAALIEHDTVASIDPKAPSFLFRRRGWITGLSDADEAASPLPVQLVGDACIERARQYGLDKIHLITGVPPLGTTTLLGRPFKKLAEFKYCGKHPVWAVEISTSSAA